MEKTEGRCFQIIRVWDLLSQQNVARTVQRLENLFSMYTDDYLDRCRRVQTQGYVFLLSLMGYTPVPWIFIPLILREMNCL